MISTEISIPRPDDWHVHLRDGAILNAVLPDTAGVFARAVVMPNLRPPVTTAASAASYRSRIQALLPPNSGFTPLMTCYLTDSTDPADLRAGYDDGVFIAAKLYPAGATTNAEDGVTDFGRLGKVLEVMQALGMPLLIHGEIADPDVDIFDREAVFVERTLGHLCDRYPELPIVLEHVTTADGTAFVESQGPNVAATITPHHLMINRNTIFRDGIRPHYYCLPIAKRERHRCALRAAATSGNPKFFLGTDSAPHLIADKQSASGCAGVYNAATAMSCYAQVFEEERRLERLAGFAAQFGADFYRLPRNTEMITLRRLESPATSADIELSDAGIRPFLPDTPVFWEVARGAA
ncbi:MAG TPA: dihydroorotase [Gammaproteobacteria bacterium]|nr:dihydroorotase [Gammaproteobacteria bacterium]